eukprot:jgi/Mesvir1/25373/Mv01416-RA.1
MASVSLSSADHGRSWGECGADESTVCNSDMDDRRSSDLRHRLVWDSTDSACLRSSELWEPCMEDILLGQPSSQDKGSLGVPPQPIRMSQQGRGACHPLDDMLGNGAPSSDNNNNNGGDNHNHNNNGGGGGNAPLSPCMGGVVTTSSNIKNNATRDGGVPNARDATGDMYAFLNWQPPPAPPSSVTGNPLLRMHASSCASPPATMMSTGGPHANGSSSNANNGNANYGPSGYGNYRPVDPSQMSVARMGRQLASSSLGRTALMDRGMGGSARGNSGCNNGGGSRRAGPVMLSGSAHLQGVLEGSGDRRLSSSTVDSRACDRDLSDMLVEPSGMAGAPSMALADGTARSMLKNTNSTNNSNSSVGGGSNNGSNRNVAIDNKPGGGLLQSGSDAQQQRRGSAGSLGGVMVERERELGGGSSDGIGRVVAAPAEPSTPCDSVSALTSLFMFYRENCQADEEEEDSRNMAGGGMTDGRANKLDSDNTADASPMRDRRASLGQPLQRSGAQLGRVMETSSTLTNSGGAGGNGGGGGGLRFLPAGCGGDVGATGNTMAPISSGDLEELPRSRVGRGMSSLNDLVMIYRTDAQASQMESQGGGMGSEGCSTMMDLEQQGESTVCGGGSEASAPSQATQAPPGMQQQQQQAQPQPQAQHPRVKYLMQQPQQQRQGPPQPSTRGMPMMQLQELEQQESLHLKQQQQQQQQQQQRMAASAAATAQQSQMRHLLAQQQQAQAQAQAMSRLPRGSSISSNSSGDTDLMQRIHLHQQQQRQSMLPGMPVIPLNPSLGMVMGAMNPLAAGMGMAGMGMNMGMAGRPPVMPYGAVASSADAVGPVAGPHSVHYRSMVPKALPVRMPGAGECCPVVGEDGPGGRMVAGPGAMPPMVPMGGLPARVFVPMGAVVGPRTVSELAMADGPHLGIGMAAIAAPPHPRRTHMQEVAEVASRAEGRKGGHGPFGGGNEGGGDAGGKSGGEEGAVAGPLVGLAREGAMSRYKRKRMTRK